MYNLTNFDGENITVKDGKVKELTADPMAIRNEIANIFNDVENGSSSLDPIGVLCYLETQKERTEAIFKDEFQNARNRDDISLNARRAYVLWEDITKGIDLLKAGGCELAAASFADATEFVKS